MKCTLAPNIFRISHFIIIKKFRPEACIVDNRRHEAEINFGCVASRLRGLEDKSSFQTKPYKMLIFGRNYSTGLLLRRNKLNFYHETFCNLGLLIRMFQRRMLKALPLNPRYSKINPKEGCLICLKKLYNKKKGKNGIRPIYWLI